MKFRAGLSDKVSMNMLSIPFRKMVPKDFLRQRPEILTAAQGKTGRPTIYSFDIDQTALLTYPERPTTTFSNRPVLREIYNILAGLNVASISTGNHLPDQEDRIVPYMVNFLKARNVLELMSNFHFFANRGGSRLVFNKKGLVDRGASEVFSAEAAIDRDQLSEIRGGLADIFPEYLWMGTRQRVEPRECFGHVVQITVKPFQVWFHALDRINEMMDKRNLAKTFYQEPSGSSSIDIMRIGIDKARPIRKLMEEYRSPRTAATRSNIRSFISGTNLPCGAM